MKEAVPSDGEMLVFRTNEPQPEPRFPADIGLRQAGSPVGALPIARAYASLHGWPATLKMLAKTATSRRSYYAATRGRRIVSEGWITRGRCRLYPIEPDDFVIGPIFTAASERGRGLAHACLARAINHCLREGARWVYIDTTTDNAASRKVIAKSGMKPL